MTTSEPIPALSYPSQNTHITAHSGIAKSIANPTSLSLEVVKGIWRKYPKLPDTNNTIAGVGAIQSSSQHSNVLELNLGTQSLNDVSSGSPNSPVPNTKVENEARTHTEGEHNVLPATCGNIESPTSERVVEDLIVAAHASMKVTPIPQANNELLSSFAPSPSSLPSKQTSQDNGAVLDSVVSSSASKHNLEIHSIEEVRSVMLDSMWKTVRHCYPDKDIDKTTLGQRFAQKVSDSDVRDFMQMGKEIIEQLRHAGKLEEIKRKYISDGDEDVQRWTKRRVDSPSMHRPDGESQRSLEAATSQSITPVRSNTLRNVLPPRAPRAMLSNHWRDAPPDSSVVPAVPVPVPTTLHRSAPISKHEDIIVAPPLSPGEIHEDDVPITKTPHPPTPPPSIQIPPATSSNSQTSPSIESSTDRKSLHNNTNSRAESIAPQSLPVPIGSRILLAKVGLETTGVLDASFELDEHLVSASRRWAERSKQFDPSESCLRIYLISIPTSAAEAAFHDLPPGSPPSLLAEKVFQTNVAWPPLGTFFVSLNMDRPEAISWAETFFGPSSSALDISGVVVQGGNDIQFVHLDDHSSKVFIVVAIPPSQAEREEALTAQFRPKAWAQLSQATKIKLI